MVASDIRAGSVPKLAIYGVVLAVLWFVPPPRGLDPSGWRVLVVFAATIFSFVLRPLPMGAMVLGGLVLLAATNTLGATNKEAFRTALRGFGDSTVWLVVSALLISGAVIGTGLGRRIALTLISLLGRTTLGLGYATAAAELILGPVVPSNTARGGGVMAPIMDSLSRALGSTPQQNPRAAGDYLMLCGAHVNLITAAMFLTGMAANPLVSKAASSILQVQLDWNQWLLGSIVPGLIGLALLPALLYRLAPPQRKETVDAQREAREELRAMGNWTYGQTITSVVFVLLLGLWTTKPWHGLETALVALIGVVILLFSGVQRWQDMAGNAAAWDTLVWLGGLLTMATALEEYGVVAWFARDIEQRVGGLPMLTAAIVLALVYFYSMYGFSMLTGHITALVGAFFLVAQGAAVPAMLIVALLAYFSNLCGCLTNYSTGPVIVYFGLGYVPAARWFRIGFLISLFHLAVWLGVGLPYWKWLGWW